MTKYRIVKAGNDMYYTQFKSWFMWWNIDSSFTLEGAKQVIEVHKKDDEVVYID